MKLNLRSFALSAALLAAFLLAGCGGVQRIIGQPLGLSAQEFSQLSPSEKVYLVKVQFRDLNSMALIYARRPVCADGLLVGCADQRVVRKIFNAADDVKRELVTVDALLAANAGKSELELAAVAANEALRRLIAVIYGNGAQAPPDPPVAQS